MKKRILVLLTAVVVALSMTAGPVFAGGTGGDYGKHGKGKVCVKHYTASEKNPYEYILIPKKAFYKGHKKHGDKIVDKKYCEKKDEEKPDKKKGKVCVKHYTASEKNPYEYILIPKKAFYKGHKKHGDHIVDKKFCEKKDDHQHGY